MSGNDQLLRQIFYYRCTLGIAMSFADSSYLTLQVALSLKLIGNVNCNCLPRHAAAAFRSAFLRRYFPEQLLIL